MRCVIILNIRPVGVSENYNWRRTEHFLEHFSCDVSSCLCASRQWKQMVCCLGKRTAASDWTDKGSTFDETALVFLNDKLRLVETLIPPWCISENSACEQWETPNTMWGLKLSNTASGDHLLPERHKHFLWFLISPWRRCGATLGSAMQPRAEMASFWCCRFSICWAIRRQINLQRAQCIFIKVTTYHLT